MIGLNSNNCIDAKNSIENCQFKDIQDIRMSMNRILHIYFKENQSQLIYFIINDSMQVERLEMNKLNKNRIIFEINEWKKQFKEFYLIKIYLEIIKNNKIENNKSKNILGNKGFTEEFDEFNNKEKENEIENEINNGLEDDNDNINNSICMEDILKIKVNRDIDEENIIQKNEENILESSCNAEYYESTNIIPLDEYEKHIEKDINKIDEVKVNYEKVSSDIYTSSNLSSMEFLKKKIKSNF